MHRSLDLCISIPKWKSPSLGNQAFILCSAIGMGHPFSSSPLQLRCFLLREGVDLGVAKSGWSARQVPWWSQCQACCSLQPVPAGVGMLLVFTAAAKHSWQCVFPFFCSLQPSVSSVRSTAGISDVLSVCTLTPALHRLLSQMTSPGLCRKSVAVPRISVRHNHSALTTGLSSERKPHRAQIIHSYQVGQGI